MDNEKLEKANKMQDHIEFLERRLINIKKRQQDGNYYEIYLEGIFLVDKEKSKTFIDMAVCQITEQFEQVKKEFYEL